MFAKIFTQIFDSSIVENPEVRFTFMDMLVLSDINGVVDMTHEAIARRTNRPVELIRSTISELESPDQRSRTPDAAGKRLARLDKHRDWGWIIINYDRFRGIASEEQKREKTLARVRRHRSKTRPSESRNASVTLRNALVTDANASNAMQRQKQRQMERGEANPPAEKLLTSERITIERSLERVNERLKELKEADFPKSVLERKELRVEKTRLLGILGLKA